MLKDKSFLTILTVFLGAVLVVLGSLIFSSLGYGKEFSFYLLSTLIVISAVAVVTVSNLVYSGFLLVLTFVLVSGIYMLLNADFLAAAQILINGGAVTIMLIFAIWLTNNKNDTANIPYSGYYRYTAFVFVGLGLFLVLVLRITGINFNPTGTPVLSVSPGIWNILEPIKVNTTEKIGQLFFNEYLVPFELASILLLMALIGAIVLALREYKFENKEENLKNKEEEKVLK
ncbi:MAG: NADH:ubiquinone oxidoreductase subunit J [Candidatus Sericytochromatia bacterium]|nr:MAG: NADH:ubiquinone oxidoreductase subunit J [Candidatus Sericytochromatia bacterium]